VGHEVNETEKNLPDGLPLRAGLPLRGGLGIYKPRGMSSFDVIRKLRTILPAKTRMGHAGTLDPAAQGLLLVLINEATKVQHLLKELGKEYIAEVRLGVGTDTDDMEGEITQQVEVPEITTEQIKTALSSLKGTRMQRPPRYSAIKISGQRAYKKARAGQSFELPERKVTVHNLELIAWEPPVIKIKTGVSSGTYIRSLAREIGQILDLPASLSSLVRTRIGRFSAENALELDKVTLESINNSMIAVLELVTHLPGAEVSDTEVILLIQGKPLDEGVYPELISQPVSVLYSANRSRAFLCEPRDGRLCSRRMLYSDGGEDA